MRNHFHGIIITTNNTIVGAIMTIESAKITESVVEQTALAWFEILGYSVESGLIVSPGVLERKPPGR